MSRVERHEITIKDARGTLHVVAQSESNIPLVAVGHASPTCAEFRERVAEACEKAGGLAKEVHQELSRRRAAREN